MAFVRQRLAVLSPRDGAERLWLAETDPKVDPLAAAEEPAPAKRAAVATILRDGEHGPEVLLIRRAEHPMDPWSGHMAFPGGREAPHDPDLLATAVRETREEVGLDLERCAVLMARLDALPAIARGRRVGLTIVPFVFELTTAASLSPNYEVAEWLWTPLERLFSGAAATTMPYEFEGQRLALPAYDVRGRIVWGLTHRMLETLFAQLR
jgi:8-oxo-dGTP pyrophosphatase MutT (NUDIX family)